MRSFPTLRLGHGDLRELQRLRRVRRMVVRVATRAAEDVEVVEALEVAAITEDTAEDAEVVETEEREEDIVEVEAEKGDSMMTAERTDGTTDLVVEGEIIIAGPGVDLNMFFLSVVDVAAVEATEEVVEVLGEAVVSRMVTVNKLSVVETRDKTPPPRYQIAKTDNNITDTTPSDSHNNKLRFTNLSGHSIMISSEKKT